MDHVQILQALFRWAHIVAGIIWIGLLYFFNFVNGPFAATMDAGTKKVVVPQLMPRALYWFRWGAAWTWITGVLLLLIVFWSGGLMLEGGGGLSGASIVMILVTFLVAPVYDALAKSGLGKDLRTLAISGFAFTLVIVLLFTTYGGFTYRAYVIHTGAMFGTIMAYNVWMRIWPAQRQIITATKQGTAPDAALVALAGARSRHNTYLSAPLIWTMINSHTVTPFANSMLSLFGAILVGWVAVYLIYSKAAKVPGF
jgi:uncharacterized membrane protein